MCLVSFGPMNLITTDDYKTAQMTALALFKHLNADTDMRDSSITHYVLIYELSITVSGKPEFIKVAEYK